MDFREEIEGVLKNREMDKEISLIEDFVECYRCKHGIVPVRGDKWFEFSCTNFQEDYNLLYVQLVGTVNGYGSWGVSSDSEYSELNYAPNREMVLERMLKDLDKLK